MREATNQQITFLKKMRKDLSNKHGDFGLYDRMEEAVLQESKSEGSPIHDLFEWDDKKAATEWRKIQATSLVRPSTAMPRIPSRVSA